MNTIRIEGTVRNGMVVLPEGYSFPDDTTLYVEIPAPERTIRVRTPRLANKEDAIYFVKTIERDIED